MSMADSPQPGGADVAGAAGGADGPGVAGGASRSRPANGADVAETITVGVSPAEAYQAVSDVRRMARWSPECFAVLVWSRKDGLPARFVGLNRRGPWVWFTTCHVVAALPGEEFAFDVTTFGMPVARWSYRMTADGGGTEVTESWWDQRGRGAHVLGRVFTGKVANHRAEANREGMRTTLARLKRELEAG
jgi:Polyketide cyclase / dehydrase and lipid transport